MPSMQERFVTELRERDPATVDLLYLDNSEGGVIGGIDEKLTSLITLSMVNCNLTNLKGLPSLPTLSMLDISDNQLGADAGLDILAKNTPELKRLILTSNKFTSIEELRNLKMLTQLVELELTNNDKLGLTEDYRVKMFEMIPSLKVLDGVDVDGEEVDEDFVGGEDAGGEDSAEEGEESDVEDEGEEGEEGPGLSYLDKSQFSDDETDDYQPKEGEEGEARGTKRPASADDESKEPEAKKTAE